jgi:hypothetical protein
MAQHGAVTAGQHRRETAPAPRDERGPDRVDAAVKAVQPPPLDPPAHRETIEPERLELREAHDAMLPRRELRGAAIGWGGRVAHTAT